MAATHVCYVDVAIERHNALTPCLDRDEELSFLKPARQTVHLHCSWERR